MRSSEAGFLPLLALAFWVGATVWEQAEFMPDPTYCHTVTGFEYRGRDESGRPEFDYPERRVCYEHER